MSPGPAGRPRAALAAALLVAAGCAGGVTSFWVPVDRPRPASLAAELYRPGGQGPAPAVVLLHGCGGPSANVTGWARWLAAEGYAALALDSFSGRGLKRLCGDSRPLTPRARAADVWAAAAALRHEPGIDGERIAAIGFSHGGSTVLWAARTEAQHPGARLRAFVAFYPGCGDVDSLPGATPILMLLGGRDDWTPPERCQSAAGAARAEGRPVTAVTYPEARHAFDASHLRGRVWVAEARRGQGATIEYDPRAHADAERQLRAFLAAHLGP